MTGALDGPVLAIERGILVAAPGERELVPEGTVVVRGNEIEWAGPAAECPALPGSAARIDASGCAVLPGLVNTHAQFRGFRALGDGLGFFAWHDRYVHRFAERMTPGDAYVGAINTFAECPRSNARYGNGIAPLRAQLDTGVTVGLGTDAPDSTFACDLLAEAQAAALLARASARDPQALSSGEAMRLATSGGAAALGMSAQVGRLRPGLRADVIVIDLTGPWTVPALTRPPHDNVLPLLVFAATAADVRDVLVDGQLLVRDRQFTRLDPARVAAECQRRAERILAELP
jgi:cytosine/adenosine deaminase-related metal-dependent hydrolase